MKKVYIKAESYIKHRLLTHHHLITLTHHTDSDDRILFILWNAGEVADKS